MEISQEEYDDLRARAMANSSMIVSLMIALKHKKMITDQDVEILVEATISSFDTYPDPILNKVAIHVENMRQSVL